MKKIDLDPSKVGNMLDFLLNSKKLEVNSDKTLETFFSTELKIIVLDKDCIIGSFSMGFVDESSNKVDYLYFHENEPLRWRKVDKGLNIFGNCNNPKCEKYNSEVVYPTILENQKLIFNLSEGVLDIKCPICQKIIKTKKFGFLKCEYQIIGKKIAEGGLTDFVSMPKEINGDNLEYFVLFENEETKWIELFVYVIPKQEMKYESN